MGPNGSENFKKLLLLQIVAESFQTCPEFSSQWSSQNYVWNFWNFEIPTFNDFFPNISNSPLYSMENQKTSIIWKTSDLRAKRGEIWDVQLLKLWPIAKFHAQIWQFWKMAYISETAARGAKISSISTLRGRKRIYVQLLELWPLAKFHAQIWQF